MNFFWTLEFIFNEIVFQWNLTDTALCKQLTSHNNLAGQTISTKVEIQEQVGYGTEMHKLTKCKWVIK